MTTTTVTPAVPNRVLRQAADVLWSELSKLHSVRSTYWTLGGAVFFNVVLGVLAAIFIPGALSAQDKASVDPIRLALAGIHLSQITFGVLGVLVISSEYTSGTIRATFAATPQRRLVLAAKVVALTLVGLVTATAASFAGYLAFHLALTDDSLSTTLATPAVLRAVFGGGLYLTALGLLGLGLGIIIRSSAGAIATLFGILFVPSILMSLLPQAWQTTIGPYLPMEAGSAIFIANNHGSANLSPWTGFAVFCAYALVSLVAGFLIVRHRDV